MNIRLSLVTIVATTALFVGCGGGGNSGGNNGDGSKSGKKVVNDTQPIVSLTCNRTLDSSAVDVTYKFGTDSNSIEMDCDNQNVSYVFNLPSSLEISNIEREEAMVGTASNIGAYTSVETQNLKTGERHIKGQGGGKSIDCIEKYTPATGTVTAYDGHDLEEYIDYDLEDHPETRISTTCPAWFYDDSDDDDYINYSGKGTILTNIVITDSSGQEHKLSTQISTETK
jgi:hypothetical protein